jgi:hypothetical protein
MLNTRLTLGSTIRELIRVSISSKERHVVTTMGNRAFSWQAWVFSSGVRRKTLGIMDNMDTDSKSW